jgi:hypothetical protein
LRILRETAWNWPLLAAGAVVFGLAGVLPAAAQGLRLEQVDQASRNPEFAAYRAALLDAVRRRDVDFVVDRADLEIKLSFGGDYGRENFRRALIGKEEWQGEYYWRELQAVLELGGVFMEDGAFCTPYLACIDVPGCPECDPFETVYVTRADAVARVEPDANAEVAAKLSWVPVEPGFANGRRLPRAVRKDRGGMADDGIHRRGLKRGVMKSCLPY